MPIKISQALLASDTYTYRQLEIKLTLRKVLLPTRIS